MDAAKTVTATFERSKIGVQVGRANSTSPNASPALTATLTARPGCGPFTRIQFGETGVGFNNARVTITAPPGGPGGQAVGFSYVPLPGSTTVSFNIERVVQSGGATVSPIRLFDTCGEWTTLVGGGSEAFR